MSRQQASNFVNKSICASCLSKSIWLPDFEFCTYVAAPPTILRDCPEIKFCLCFAIYLSFHCRYLIFETLYYVFFYVEIVPVFGMYFIRASLNRLCKFLRFLSHLCAHTGFAQHRSQRCNRCNNTELLSHCAVTFCQFGC